MVRGAAAFRFPWQAKAMATCVQSFGDLIIATAMLDRLLRHSTTIAAIERPAQGWLVPLAKGGQWAIGFRSRRQGPASGRKTRVALTPTLRSTDA